MKSRNWNSTEKREWGKNREKKTLTCKCCFTSKKHCARGTAKTNSSAQPFVWKKPKKQKMKNTKKEMLFSEPSRHKSQLYWTGEDFYQEHPLERTLWDYGTIRWTGQTNPMQQSMGVFRATELSPHLLGFASRVWNLFSSNISFHEICCLICCPCQCICSHSFFPAAPQKIKDQFCW